MTNWGSLLPYPSTVYPGEAYPGGLSRPGWHFIDKESRWSRILGPGTCRFFVDGVEAFPRTVEHDIRITRGRSGTLGAFEPQALQARFTGIADPVALVGARATVMLDGGAIDAKLGRSFTPGYAARAQNVSISDLDRVIVGMKDSPRAITTVTATGNLSKAARLFTPAAFPSADPAKRWADILWVANQINPAITRALDYIPPGGPMSKAMASEPRSVSDLISTFEATYLGSAFETRSGTIGYLPEVRPSAVTSATISAGYVRLGRRGQWKQSVQDVINSYSVTYGQQLVDTPTDQPRVDLFGLYQARMDCIALEDDTADKLAAANMARAMIVRRSVPPWKPPPLGIDLLDLIELGQVDTAAAIANLEIGGTVTISDIANAYPTIDDAPSTPGTSTFWVEGITESITPDSWLIELTVSPRYLHQG